MPLVIRQSKTATGRPELIVGAECTWQEFPKRASEIITHFGMIPGEQVDGLDERMWLTNIGDAIFSISWDVWSSQVSIMAWQETPDAAVARLTAGA